MSLYEFWTRCLLHSRCYWGKEETMEGKQTLNVKFRNGSVGNCMLKIPTSRTFFWTKTFINFSTVAFWCLLKVGFATRLFIRTAYLLVNQKKAGSTHFHPVFVCPCRCLEAGLPHLKKRSPRSFPFIQTSEVLAQYHPFTHELNPWSDQRLRRAPVGLSLSQNDNQF